MRYTLLYSFIFLLTIGTGSAQTFERSIALLDLTVQNGETNDGQVYSAEQMLKVAGVPYSITTEPLDAMQYAMVFCSSYLDSKTLSAEEKTSLIDYVSNGGVVIASRVTDEVLYPIFGISGSISSNTNYLLHWNSTLSTSLFRWINEPEEWTVSLGKSSSGDIFKTISYDLSTAIELGHYDNESVAVTENKYNSGYAYAFGFNWKEVILRPLINRDYEAQRIGSNGFEPSVDVFMLLARTIFMEHIPYAVWKHTSPNNSSSTLMITHDIDSSTGIDSMYVFSESEKNLGITANYNITVRYASDVLMTDFYNGSSTEINKLLSDGHSIASHSVGHFPDFGDDAVFPIGSPGNTKNTYLPYNDGVSTVGGTVYGEMEVSKDMLEADFGQDIKIYRTGHLVYNKYMVEVMDELGYLYNSSFSANEVLTNFPFQNKTGRSFSGTRSNIYEFPVSISDVYHDDPMSSDNYLEKVELWLGIISKIDANSASTVVLIHPNRRYKLLGEELLFSSIPQSIAIKEMGAFGDYWKAREALTFTSELTDKTMKIGIKDADLLLNSEISFIINNGQDLDLIYGISLGNIPIEFDSEPWGTNDLILYNFKFSVGTNDISTLENQMNIKIIPNPVDSQFSIEMDLLSTTILDIEFMDIYAKSIKKKLGIRKMAGHQTINFDISELHLAKGIYLCKINLANNNQIVKKVIVH